MKIVLASASPRRKQLLEEAGYDVTCVVSGAEEIEDHSFLPADLAMENAARKARLVAGNSPDHIVLAADTVVWRDGRFFGKPSDMEEAFRMLQELAGQTHEVVTGVVIHFPGGEITAFAESSLVTFHALADDGIRCYLDSIHPLDKAGAYAAQGDNGRIIKKIDGSVTNVIGLPVERVGEILGGKLRACHPAVTGQNAAPLLMTMENVHWYCVKARPRQERAARVALANEVGVEVFCPLLRFERARKSGRVRVVEAMFPGYLFARFCYDEQYRIVATTNGVSTIVSFGGIPAVVPDAIIGELRASVAGEETVDIPVSLAIGEEVQVVEGPFQGIRAIVTSVMPARARVTVLLELLGMEREVEVSEKAVLPDMIHPMAPR